MLSFNRNSYPQSKGTWEKRKKGLSHSSLPLPPLASHELFFSFREVGRQFGFCGIGNWIWFAATLEIYCDGLAICNRFVVDRDRAIHKFAGQNKNSKAHLGVFFRIHCNLIFDLHINKMYLYIFFFRLQVNELAAQRDRHGEHGVQEATGRGQGTLFRG